jgi:hypothetical protein
MAVLKLFFIVDLLDVLRRWAKMRWLSLMYGWPFASAYITPIVMRSDIKESQNICSVFEKIK